MNRETPLAEQHGWSDLNAQATKECTRRRARVLSHPDIARMLTQFPLRLTNPDKWTGFIPPQEIPTLSGWKRNTSPIRAQLVAIMNAVDERENQLDFDGPPDMPELEPPPDEDQPPPPHEEDMA